MLNYSSTQLQRQQHNYSSIQQQFLYRTGFVERSTNLQTKLSSDEEQRRLHKHWQLWDLLLWRAGCGSADDLKDYVSQPEQFILHWSETALTFSDQIPVWLKPSGAGKILQPRSVQRLAADTRRRRKSGEQAGHVHVHARGPGEATADRSAQQYSEQAAAYTAAAAA